MVRIDKKVMYRRLKGIHYSSVMFSSTAIEDHSIAKISSKLHNPKGGAIIEHF